jgi:acetoin utilization deacetylase AcuC-like enzyme
MDSPLLLGTTYESDDHDTGSGHPERKARLGAVLRGVHEAHLESVKLLAAIEPAARQDLMRVHSGSYLDNVERFIEAGGGGLDPDTAVSSGSWRSARLAAGAGLQAVRALQQGEGASAFVAVRPPGHHALPGRAMGFCIINNVAVSAAALADSGERVLIVDWDVHHGNGTQEIFWDDPRVLYVSTHQWPCYPGTGRPEETGGPGAPGLTVNVPLPPGATGDVARMALEEIAAPVVEAFRPTWVLVSAGFDAHRSDPLAALCWSAGDFADLATTVASWAPGPGRLVAFLEGGYDLDALALSAASSIAAMAGESYRPERPTSGGPGRDLIGSLAALWSNL